MSLSAEYYFNLVTISKNLAIAIRLEPLIVSSSNLIGTQTTRYKIPSYIMEIFKAIFWKFQ